MHPKKEVKIESICWMPAVLHEELHSKNPITVRREKKETKVIFNNPVTVLYMNGKKYISKAHNEAFDEEKGLLMCLAKANGISHLQLKRMLKNAQRPKTK